MNKWDDGIIDIYWSLQLLLKCSCCKGLTLQIFHSMQWHVSSLGQELKINTIFIWNCWGDLGGRMKFPRLIFGWDTCVILVFYKKYWVVLMAITGWNLSLSSYPTDRSTLINTWWALAQRTELHLLNYQPHFQHYLYAPWKFPIHLFHTLNSTTQS